MILEKLTRRNVLRASTAAGMAGATGLWNISMAEARMAGSRQPGPMLSADEMAAVDQALGKKGNVVAEQSVYTVPLPRNDLKITIKGEPVPIPFGFGGWVSFKKTRDGKSTVMMSDMVLQQDEVNGVISAAQTNGLEITAIHNHFFFEEPRIFYMHVHAMGEAGEMARAYSTAIRVVKLHPANQPPPGPPPARTGSDLFDTAKLSQIAGHPGQANGPTYKITVGRSDLTIMAMGAELTAAIGLNSWAAFAGNMERAHIAGDIAMLEPEVNPVIAALRKHNLDIVALHHHMLGETPRIIFLHYYGTGPATALAEGFRAALDELGKHGKTMRMEKRGAH